MTFNIQKELKTLWQKGEIACFEQFLLLPQCFQKTSAADASKYVYKWERVKACFQMHIINTV